MTKTSESIVVGSDMIILDRLSEVTEDLSLTIENKNSVCRFIN
jgi:hypothetical protein